MQTQMIGKNTMNVEEDYYPMTPTSTQATSEDSTWPRSPCLIKNTFLEFVPEGQQPPTIQQDPIAVLKGQVTRQRSNSLPPLNKNKEGAQGEAAEEGGNARNRAPSVPLAPSVDEDDMVSPPESRVESRVNTLCLENHAEWRMTTLDLAEIDIGAHGIYGTEWEARMAMNNLDLSINPGGAPAPFGIGSPYAQHINPAHLTQYMFHHAAAQQPPSPMQAQETQPQEHMQRQHSPGRSSAMEGAMWITQALQARPDMVIPESGVSFDAPRPGSPAQVQVQQPQPVPGEAKEGPARNAKEDPVPWEHGVVTVMIRQVPRRYSSQMQLLEKISARGFQGAINFLYLPFDMKKGVNVGYCFVGFTEHQHALRFRDVFDGSFLDKNSQVKDKPLRVHPASVQGYQASCEHFARTKTGQKQDRRFSPLFLGPDGSTPPAQALANSRMGVVDPEIEMYASEQLRAEQQAQQAQQQQQMYVQPQVSNAGPQRNSAQQWLQQGSSNASWSNQAAWQWEAPDKQQWGAAR